MDFLKLSYFVTVAKYQHITKASNEINISQPALSRIISKIEEELGVKLFDRGGRQLYINESGKMFLNFCTRVLLDYQDTVAQIRDCAQGNSGHLTIGVSFPYREPDWLSYFSRRFIMSHPNVSFYMDNQDLEQLKSGLYSRKIDLVLSDVPIIGKGIFWKELFFEYMGVLLSAKHSLAQKNILYMEDLRNEKFLCNNNSVPNHDYTVTMCNAAGFKPNICFRGTFPDIIGEAVSLGKGISIMHEAGSKGYLSLDYDWAKNLVFRPLANDYCIRRFGVAYLEDRPLPVAAQSFCEDLFSADIPMLRRHVAQGVVPDNDEESPRINKHTDGEIFPE